MILHAVSIAAFFLDPTTPAQCVVQCVQAAPESWLKWLLPTIVQTIISLASIATGVCIAVWSFRKNRQSEHERWVLDQKKAAWSQLINAIHDCHFYGEYAEILTRRIDPKHGLESIIALDRNRMLRIDQLLSSMSIRTESRLVHSIANRLTDFKRLRIQYEDEGEKTNSADSKWANALWFPAKQFAEFVDAVCSAAKTDLRIELVNEISESGLMES